MYLTSSACIDCGRCIRRCPAGAIRRTPDGYYATCILCGRCAEICPSKAIRTNRLGGLYVDKSRCTGCGLCAAVCPTESIEMVENRPRGICLNCGLCAKVCPVGARVKVPTDKGLGRILPPQPSPLAVPADTSMPARREETSEG